MRLVFTLLFTLFCVNLYAQDTLRTYTTKRVTSPIKIDGVLDDEEWKDAEIANDFVQNQPYQGEKANQRTEVKILYDNIGIYVGAMLYDSSPDSILHELAIRDAQNINADHFRFVIDPYNKRQDGFDFGVYPTGVQTDSKMSDPTFDAVWHSAAKINDKGWVVEMFIPYSAIRFPDSKEQEWGLQLTRSIRRTREFDQWALTPNGKANPLRYWGTLKGVSNIEAPLRLSFTPFVSAYYSQLPIWTGTGYTTTRSISYTAGADVKYGIDDRFTLDMTLFPDFGQVQSDNKIKNLSYQEVTYNENRAFFKEGTELFTKGNLFYSRRIGRTPSGYYNVPYEIDENERIIENPSQVKLLNAAKLSGRTNNGLGLGLLNAVTANSYATIEDSTGRERKILTEPLTNYNIIVLDQQLNNNNNIYFINTNVARASMYDDANVTGTGVELVNKESTWGMKVEGALTQKFSKLDSTQSVFQDQIGYTYFAGLGKISGNFQISGYTKMASPAYDARDLGFFSITNYRTYGIEAAYNVFTPKKYFRNSYNEVEFSYREYLGTGQRTGFDVNWESFTTLHSFHSVMFGGGTSPLSNYDYYESRTPNRYFKTAEYIYFWYGLSSDYRKKLAVDLNISHSWFLPYHHGNYPNYPGHNFNTNIRYRFNDHLTISYRIAYGIDPYNVGFVMFDSTAILFGGRKLETYENGLNIKYIFKRDMMLTAIARHYWNTGQYIDYYALQEDGNLDKTYSDYKRSFSTNFFNIDVVYSWIFAPGSMLSINYKNAIEDDSEFRTSRFDENFKYTFLLPQANTVSMRLLYFLDYQYLRKNKPLKQRTEKN